MQDIDQHAESSMRGNEERRRRLVKLVFWRIQSDGPWSQFQRRRFIAVSRLFSSLNRPDNMNQLVQPKMSR